MFRKTIEVKTRKEKEIVDITDDIKRIILDFKVKDGNCFIFVTHTTCAITTADLDPGTDLDYIEFLGKIIPQMKFRHPHNPAHAPSHILSSIVGSSVVIPVEDGHLTLGTWQRIVLVELDGPRDRIIIVSSS